MNEQTTGFTLSEKGATFNQFSQKNKAAIKKHDPADETQQKKIVEKASKKTKFLNQLITAAKNLIYA